MAIFEKVECRCSEIHLLINYLIYFYLYFYILLSIIFHIITNNKAMEGVCGRARELEREKGD